MKAIITSLAAALCPLFAMSQTEPADTVSSHELHEIVIQAPKVIRKADMDVYHPSKSAVENSINGMQLLNNLMIPALTVNDPGLRYGAANHVVKRLILFRPLILRLSGAA